jgi:hypothetical protein
MAGNPHDIAFVYQVQQVGTSFVLVDGDTDTTNGLSPITDGMNLIDNIDDPTIGGTDGGDFLGDALSDQFRVAGAGGASEHLNGVYSFVSLALTSDAGSPTDASHFGFIAQDAAGDFFYFTNNLVDPSLADPALTQQSGIFEICFMPGTRIATLVGETEVEKLRVGDMVRTADGRSLPVRWIGRQTVSVRFADALRLPIRVKASALADGVPSRDLLVSPAHALFVEGVLVQAGALVNGTSITRERNVPPIFTYYQVELDDHALILAENTPAETFIDNVERYGFDNWHEHESLYPQGKALVEMAYPRVKAYRQLPRPIREELALRAALLMEIATARAA